jgi:hypothetical protein
MTGRLMVLPSKDPARILLVTVPEDLGPQEAYRLVTGLVAGVGSVAGEGGLADVLEALEGRGFEAVEFALGPALD